METKRKTRIGQVVSTKMAKTAVVAVPTVWQHPLYKKTVRLARKYKAHDENDQCQLGDKVRIIETRPISKEKRWRVVEIISRHEVAEVQPREIDMEAEKKEA